MVGKSCSARYRSSNMDMDSLHNINDILDCSVCFERLNETCKVLPCQHTFCKSCLRAIVASTSRQELRCPECRSLVTEDIDKLPGNIMLIRLLEGLKHTQRKRNSTPPPNCKIPFDEPCARAVFGYEPREPGDLTLKKGDLVVLIKKVDDNWYIGELSGKQGYLPANFVEVINPLPKFNEADEPLARGLYDFEDENAEDLLPFKQGEIITVLRRVDVNWCEGKIGDRCGIFPLNFVQLNHSASQLIKLGKGSDPIRQTEPNPKIPVRLLGARLNRKRASAHRPPVKRSRSIPRDNPENLRRRIRDFGQSGVIPNRASLVDQTNRHSIEVTSAESSQDFSGRENDAVALPVRTGNVSVRRRLPHDSAEEDTPNTSSSRSSPTELQDRNVQNLYIALYNYRPQKSDELELCSGEHYKVLEKGADGWFKGFAVLRRQNIGHFPGNYVRLISDKNPTNESLLRRRRNRSGQNAGAESLVLPRPRPFSDISNESNQDSEYSPPLTPPLVGVKPPKHGLLRRLSIGKKKDRSSPQTIQQPSAQNERVTALQPDTGSASTSSRASRSTQPSSSRTRTDGRQSSRTHTVSREKYRVTANYPPHNPRELELKCGDIVYVTKKQNDGWYHGTLERTGKVGFFPKSFVQKI